MLDLTTTAPGPLAADVEEIVVAAARRHREHPYHRAFADGTLPPVVYAHYARQDSYHLLPDYGRAFARCAARAAEPTHARFLSRMAAICLDSVASDMRTIGDTLRGLGLSPEHSDGAPPVAPATRSYTYFLTAAGVTSLAAGLGALLPSALLQMRINDHLLTHYTAGSRYAALIEQSHPGEEYRRLVDELLVLVNEVGAGASTGERAELLRFVAEAVRHEWAFLEAAWRLQT